MSNIPTNQYEPDHATPPGNILEEYLEAYKMTQAELADRTGLTKETVNEIIKAKARITPYTAVKLHRIFKRPAHFWNNLQHNYEQTLARLAEQERLHSHLNWLKQIPVTAMIKRGWIIKHQDKTAQLEEVLRFYGIATPEQWQVMWEKHQVAYRYAQHYKACAYAVSAWLRRGEIEAQQLDCAPFDKTCFTKEILEEIRALTHEPLEMFQSRLIALCAAAGVAVVLVAELPKIGVHGATRWLGNRPLIQLSLRYKSNDQFWFTFFHEAGHIVKHGRKAVFLEGEYLEDKQEVEADTFARDKLIPPKALQRFLETQWPTLTAIERFADEIGIAPGIVVGRLQHDGVLPRNRGNKLKVFYRYRINSVPTK